MEDIHQNIKFYINWGFKLACIKRLELGVTKSKLLWCREQETAGQFYMV